VVQRYNIYRANGPGGAYSLLDTVNYSATSIYNDFSAQPNLQSYRYRMTAMDSCGNQSDSSELHRTMHLTLSQGIGAAIDLTWNSYVGFSFKSYRIYRTNSSGNIVLLDSVQNTITTYTDPNPPTSTGNGAPGLEYFVEVIRSPGCIPNTTMYNSSRSNIAFHSFSYVGEVDGGFGVEVYPNPVSGVLHVDVRNPGHEDYTVTLHNILGEVVYEVEPDAQSDASIEIDIKNEAAGVYLVRVRGADGIVARKVVKIK